MPKLPLFSPVPIINPIKGKVKDEKFNPEELNTKWDEMIPVPAEVEKNTKTVAEKKFKVKNEKN